MQVRWSVVNISTTSEHPGVAVAQACSPIKANLDDYNTALHFFRSD